MGPLQAAVYVRISDDKAEDAAGVGRQESDCRDLAQRQGWTVAEVYVENDTSAYKRKRVRLPDGTTALRVVRPAFRQMLDALAAGAFDALVGYDLDRIARDPRDLEDLIDVVEAGQVPTKAVTGSLDLSTDAGITMARVMVAIANKSSRDSSRRIARKHLELAEQGKTGGGGIRAFGYERDGLTVNADEADAVRLIAQRVLDGKSLVGIAASLNEAGVPTVRGGHWQTRSVHAVVSKPRVAGLRVHRGEVVGQAVWPAILDRDTWERVLLALAARAAGSTNTMQRWLTGLLRCGRCGHGLTGSQQGKDRGPRYWCATTRGGCGGIGINALRTEQHLERLLLGYLERPDVLDDLRAATSSESVERVRLEARQDEAQLQELAGMWAARAVSTPEYMRARRDIEQRLVRSRSLVRAALPASVRRLVSQDVRSAWADLTPAQRREVATAVFPEGVRVDAATKAGRGRFEDSRVVPLGWEDDDTPGA